MDFLQCFLMLFLSVDDYLLIGLCPEEWKSVNGVNSLALMFAWRILYEF